MKKFLHLFTISILIIVTLGLLFVGCTPNNKKAKDVDFRILQLADIQFSTSSGMPERDKALLDKMISESLPDLIVLTGDQMGSKTTGEKALEVAKQIVDYFDSKEINWTAVFGNHDGESNYLSKKGIYEVYSSSKFFINTDEKWNGLKSFSDNNDSLTNFSIPVKKSSGEILCNLLLLDTQTVNPYGKGYAPLTEEQKNFYNSEGERLAKEYGKTIPMLMFTHVPPMMYRHVYDKKDDAKIVSKHVGENEELGNPPNIAAPLNDPNKFEYQMLKNKDIKGVFAGHDHLNYFVGQYHPFADSEYISGKGERKLGLTQDEINEIKGKSDYNLTLAFCRQSSYQLGVYPGMKDTFIRGGRVIDIKGATFETSDLQAEKVKDKNIFKVKLKDKFIGSLT